jgi:hypothetical protein
MVHLLMRVRMPPSPALHVGVIFLVGGNGGASLVPFFRGKPLICRRLVGVVALVGGVMGADGSDDGDIYVFTPVGASSLWRHSPVERTCGGLGG